MVMIFGQFFRIVSETMTLTCNHGNGFVQMSFFDFVFSVKWNVSTFAMVGIVMDLIHFRIIVALASSFWNIPRLDRMGQNKKNKQNGKSERQHL